MHTVLGDVQDKDGLRTLPRDWRMTAQEEASLTTRGWPGARCMGRDRLCSGVSPMSYEDAIFCLDYHEAKRGNPCRELYQKKMSLTVVAILLGHVPDPPRAQDVETVY